MERAPERSVTRPGVGLETLEPRLRTLLPAELYAPVWLHPDADGLHRVFVHLRTLLRILYDQMPSHVADDPPPTVTNRHEWQSGTLMFTDLAGFTPFIEANATRGPEGIRVVHEVLNRYLAAMIDIFGHAGGNLLEFTGDALLIRVAGDERGNDTRRAINAALRMQRAMSEFREITTPFGTASFGMRVGIHVGGFLATDVGTPRRRDHVLFGQAVRRTKDAEGSGVVGRVCLTPEAA
ncbi:MAG: adenylate/guanylate cyclase domain-containing protein [Ilumatobacteraceae bacterium]